MKTKLISLILLTAITAALILTGCGNGKEPDFGATGAKEYQPTLSEMSDQAIRDRIDELYDTAKKGSWSNNVLILVHQNELILRQLEDKMIITVKGLLRSSSKEGAKGMQFEKHKKLKKLEKGQGRR